MKFINTAGLTEDQQMIRDSVLDLLNQHLPLDSIRQMDEDREFPHKAYNALAEAGFTGLFYPEEYGGAGASAGDLTALVEALGYHYTGIAQAYMTTVIYAGMHIVNSGSHELKARVLPDIISGKTKLALAMSEPGTGSDVAGIKTSAIRDGDHYVLNGNKIWITCAHVADKLVVICKTDPNAGRHKGVSTLLVDTNAPGVEIRPLKMLGRRTTHANEIFFTDVKVPVENLIGEESGAWKSVMKCLNVERLCLSAISAGHCYRITEYAADYARDRIQFGQPISQFQVIQHKLVDMLIAAEIARQAAWRVADLMDKGENPIRETSIAKIVSSESNVKCADIGLQVMGGAGYSAEYLMEMFYRDCRVGPIGGGSNEIQRNVIAKQMDL
ncbi:acyl-CoA dehydrogenase family protein [Pontivivens nitratireducens]|uniref:acyl-CoA dehydrogenase family protein n=1 Tax=Pontivivens nitratireducens TaxID=2758038 RepID=UPI0016396A4B|nr:acyl-CoA dehydrogenase family protein [Pontibrevibacter nitratireducens]